MATLFRRRTDAGVLIALRAALEVDVRTIVPHAVSIFSYGVGLNLCNKAGGYPAIRLAFKGAPHSTIHFKDTVQGSLFGRALTYDRLANF